MSICRVTRNLETWNSRDLGRIADEAADADLLLKECPTGLRYILKNGGVAPRRGTLRLILRLPAGGIF